jgi:regulator of sigma E protease
MSGIIDAVEAIVLFIVVLGLLVLFHEAGHFVTARLSRVRVLEFGFGFPPRAKVLAVRGGTEYTLNWLPIGGFVKLEGEDGDQDEDPRSFTRAPLWKKLLILVMGVVMNLVLAVVIFGGIAFLGTPYLGIKFASVDPGSPAQAAGLVPGDTLVSVNGTMYDLYNARYGDGSIRDQFALHAGQTIQLGLIHADGTPATVTVTLRSPADVAAQKGALGIKAGDNGFEPVILPQTASRPLGDSLRIGWSETTYWFGAIIDGLRQLGSSIVNNPTSAPPVSGPVGIATSLGDTFRNEGPIMTLYVAGILSANLALVNVLPFPPLDGGRMLVIALKAIPRFGRRISQRAEVATYAFGMLALFGFLIWVTFFDIARGLGGGGTP